MKGSKQKTEFIYKRKAFKIKEMKLVRILNIKVQPTITEIGQVLLMELLTMEKINKGS